MRNSKINEKSISNLNLMPALGKETPTAIQVMRDVTRILHGCMPESWRFKMKTELTADQTYLDCSVTLVSPDCNAVQLVIEAKRHVNPRDVPRLHERLLANVSLSTDDVVPVVVAAYLSPRTRILLRERGLSYLDTTGNVLIDSSKPGLFICKDGDDHDPWRSEQNLKSLRGRGSARAIRALIDTIPPYGVRELASFRQVSAATLSRVIGLLERNAIVTRENRMVRSVDWKAAIRLWAEDYGQLKANRYLTCLEPRGLEELEKSLRRTSINYAITGSLAAQRFEPIAPARIGAVYVEDIANTLEQLNLFESETGTNVLLLEPFDPIAFEGKTSRDGLYCVAPSQLTVDLLTGYGREPAQGEQILEWMDLNQDEWLVRVV